MLNKSRKEELEAIWKAREEDERELVSELNKIGFNIKSIYDFVNNAPHPHLKNNFTGPYNDAYPILVQHLDKPHERIIREGIIRALTEKNAHDIAKDKLIEHFYLEKDKNTQWVLANALTHILTTAEKKKHPKIKEIRYRKSS